jgi:thymidylate synthase (FAD)
MAGLVIEVQAPIFVFREWHRHRSQSYNEMSARYTPLPDLNYVPTVERLLLNSKVNKQAGVVKGAAELTTESAEKYREALVEMYYRQEVFYQRALADGVPKELARIHLPVGRYSRMRASANLRNWLAFLTLRMDANAQWEIRQFANIVGALVEKYYPRTWSLFSLGSGLGKAV